MASQSARILPPTDKQIVQAFSQIWTDWGQPEAQYQLDVGDRQPVRIEGQLEALADDPTVQVLTDSDSAIVTRAFIGLNNPKVNATVQRAETHTTLTTNFRDGLTPAEVVPIVAAVRKAFQRFEGLGQLSEVLGPQLADFYEAREAGLQRLESLAEDVVTRTDRYRLQLDERHDAKQAELGSQHAARLQALEAEYLRKGEGLDEREKALEARLAELDDRSNTHARRRLREDLKRILNERNTSFQLTKETQQKRLPIHALFILTLIFFGFFALDPLWGEVVGTTALDWTSLVRASVSVLSFGGVLAFYIRWNDQWARRHADEEFRLRQLELDVDRASWIVEMALEWREDRGTQIPQELIDRLTQGLFEGARDSKRIRHPAEDLSSALIGASNELTMNLPGLGTITLDRKGIRKFEESVVAAESD